MPKGRNAARVLGTKSTFPNFIEPALVTMIDKPVSGERWMRINRGNRNDHVRLRLLYVSAHSRSSSLFAGV